MPLPCAGGPKKQKLCALTFSVLQRCPPLVMLPKPVGVEPDSQIQGLISSILIWNYKYKLVNSRFWWYRHRHDQFLVDYLSIVSWSNIAFSCASSASFSLVLLSFSASEYFSSNSSIFFFSSPSSPYTHLCKLPVTIFVNCKIFPWIYTDVCSLTNALVSPIL